MARSGHGLMAVIHVAKPTEHAPLDGADRSHQRSVRINELAAIKVSLLPSLHGTHPQHSRATFW
ncbi:MAG TPA: hypothetical protein VGD69_26695 [Herpetosiphonaceae bacterium]